MHSFIQTNSMHNTSTQMSMRAHVHPSIHPSIPSGAILHTSLSEDQSNQYAAIISSLSQKASILISTLDPDDDGDDDGGDELNFIRIRSKKKEIMVAPDKDFLMMVIQNPSVSEGIGISLE